jgi:hypothetical protein
LWQNNSNLRLSHALNRIRRSSIHPSNINRISNRADHMPVCCRQGRIKNNKSRFRAAFVLQTAGSVIRQQSFVPNSTIANGIAAGQSYGGDCMPPCAPSA